MRGECGRHARLWRVSDLEINRTPGADAADRLPTAVLWDMDGTIVDTEPNWIEAEHALVAGHGGTWRLEDSHHLVGKDLHYAAGYLQRVGGVDLSGEEIIHRLLDVVVESVGQDLPWRPGARELIAEIGAAGIPQALVTMSWARMAGALVAGFPEGTFASVVSGDRVERGKPFPDAYELAMRELGVSPAGTTAIEDSPTGAAAALAAGAHVIVVPHMVPVDGDAYRIVDSLELLTVRDLVSPT